MRRCARPILAARAALPDAQNPRRRAARLRRRSASRLGSDGLRGELTLLRAARAQAAFEGADHRHPHPSENSGRHLPCHHRLRRDPLDEAGSGARVARILAETLP